MRRGLLFMVAAALCIFALGCGGSGGGGGDDEEINASLVGTWQPVSATENAEDGTFVQVSDTLPEPDAETTRWQLEFRSNGTVEFRAYYHDETTPVDTFSGTWSSDNQVAPIHLSGMNTITMSWGTFGVGRDGEMVMTGHYVLNGHTYWVKWVRIETLPMPEHSDALIGTPQMTWRVTEVKENNVVTSASEFFEMPLDADTETVQFQASGAMVFQPLQSGSPSGDPVNETWSNDGTVAIAFTYDGETYRGYWNILGPTLVLTVWDTLTGKTVQISCQPVE
jgi:hypothetical protein